jgi:hypothetical protein
MPDAPGTAQTPTQPTAQAQSAPAPASVDLATLKAQVAADLRPQILTEVDNTHKATLAKALGEVQATHARDLALSDAGVRDPLGRAAVLAAFDATPKADRGEGGAAEWWGRQVAAHKAHAEAPDKAPKPSIHPTVQAYLPAVTPATPAAPASPFGGQRGPASVDRGAAPRGAASALPTPKPGTTINDFLASLAPR